MTHSNGIFYITYKDEGKLIAQMIEKVATKQGYALESFKHYEDGSTTDLFFVNEVDRDDFINKFEAARPMFRGQLSFVD